MCSMKKQIIVLLIILGGFMSWLLLHVGHTSSIQPLKSEIKEIVIKEWRDCSTPEVWCSDLSVEINKKIDGWYVTAIYSGLRDDSASAMKKKAQIEFKDGVWKLGKPKITRSCAKGRGHQNFNSIPCL